ncbi:MAG: glucose-6-phosphate dehydrogenase [Acidobacteriia bacterium]|nr:glucose-6-phosphate dehydrogenase [Terriglobia bacterium]
MTVVAEPTAAPVHRRVERIPDACAMVIFGASGDLTRRKLMPALYQLARERLLPPCFSVVGNSRRGMSDDAFRAEMRTAVERFGGAVETEIWRGFEQRLFYVQGSSDDASTYQRIATRLADLDRDCGAQGNRMFYLAVSPSLMPGIAHNLQAAGLSKSAGWTRIIVEKPFGHDLQSARQLNQALHAVFSEEQVYRIDHYLGKETVQNLLVFRFANGIFDPVWNRRYVDQVQITAAETVGVENRATYYEEAGALRDMVQNHLIQLLTLTAMEPPVAFDSESVRAEKVKVLRSIRPLVGAGVEQIAVRGQYGPGLIDGQRVVGYRQEPGVNPQSSIETFVALKLHLDNWRWAGVPFYLRAGKRLPKHWTEIAVQFKQPPLALFGGTQCGQLAPNLLSIRIQPDEGISLEFAAKTPGPGMDVRPVDMDFHYATSFGMASYSAYERLLLDSMLGDATLFARSEGVELAWAVMAPILERWQHEPPPVFPNYGAGTWGPAEANALLEVGHRWRNPLPTPQPQATPRIPA